MLHIVVTSEDEFQHLCDLWVRLIRYDIMDYIVAYQPNHEYE